MNFQEDVWAKKCEKWCLENNSCNEEITKHAIQTIDLQTTKMKKLLLILLCLPMIGFGQGWETTFGGTLYETGNSVQQTTDGGYIITGHTESFGNGDYDVYLIKTDVDGVEQWNQTFGGTEADYSSSVQQTTDGGYIITGNTNSFGNDRYVYLIKTDVNGVEQWNQTFGVYSASGHYVQQTTDGGYIITGMILYTMNGDYDTYLIKTDGNGIQQWSQTFGTGRAGLSVQQTSDGGYIIAGQTQSLGNINYDIHIIKTDGNGIQQWSQTFGGTGIDEAVEIKQTTDGGYIIIGSTSAVGIADNDVYLIKTDGYGIEQWNQTFGGLNQDYGRSVKQTSDGGYIIAGQTQSFGNTNYSVYLIKTDVNGIEQWSQTSVDTNSTMGRSVQQTTDGGYIITGLINYFGNDNIDIYLMKTDENGNVTSTFNILSPSSNRKLERIVDVLGRNTKGTKNEVLFYIYDDDTVEKRIVIE